MYDPHDDSLLIELLRLEERFRIALKCARVCVFEVDLTRQLYTYFENAEEIYGKTGEEILKDVQPFSRLSPEAYQAAAFAYFSHPDDKDIISRAFSEVLSGNTFSYHARMRRKDSSFIWCKIDVTPILKDGVPVRMIGVVSDISDLIAENRTLKKQVFYDHFLGLYTKSYAIERISGILRKFSYQKHALLVMDLDNFKQINDTYGHHQGDAVLSAVARQLKSALRNTDIIGRFGGDEFILLIRNLSGCKDPSLRLSQLLDSSTIPFHVTKSIGVSLFPQDGEAFEELFQHADQALYKAKQSKNTYCFYQDAL